MSVGLAGREAPPSVLSSNSLEGQGVAGFALHGRGEDQEDPAQ